MTARIATILLPLLPIGAGAMLTERKVIEPRELWGGRPARKMRDLDDAAIAGMRIGTMHYAENAKHHAEAVAAALGVDAAELVQLPQDTRLTITALLGPDGARLFDGLVPDLEAHCARVNRSAQALISLPLASLDAWEETAAAHSDQYAGEMLRHVIAEQRLSQA